MQNFKSTILKLIILSSLSSPVFSYMDCATSPNPSLCEQTNALIKQVEEVTGQPVKPPSNGTRKIQRTLKDPVLIKARESQGLSSTLTDGEYYVLSNKTLDSKEKDIVKLLTLASMSYLESDVDAAIFYFQRILNIEKASKGKLPPESSKFIINSISRLKNPTQLNGSIGFFIYELDSDGVLGKAGIQKGDIITQVNGNIMTDVTELSQLLASKSKNKNIMIMRNNKKMNVPLNTYGSAKTKITPLIIFNPSQI